MLPAVYCVFVAISRACNLCSDCPISKLMDSSQNYLSNGVLRYIYTFITGFTELEFLKLWKGLYTCMWHSDKPLVQVRVAREGRSCC